MDASDYKIIWQQVLEEISKRVPRSGFITFFKNTALIDFDGEKGVIATASVFSMNELKDKFTQITLEAFGSIFPEMKVLEFTVDGSLHEHDERVADVLKIAPDPSKPKKKEALPQEIEGGMKTKALHDQYSLENFIVGPDNQLAHAACIAISNKPGSTYNPLFIYGGVGLGKTHLLQATGNEIKKKFPKKIIVYTTAENYMNEVITAIRTGQAEKLRTKYRLADVFIIDDIQFLANKTQTQVEFFHTFNALYEAKKQIIISSDRPPKELDELESRLRSRFEWGMMADIGFPDFETRVAILQSKCQDKGIFLSQELLAFIADNVSESIRELEGVLNQAVALYELKHVTPTIKMLAPKLKKLQFKTQAIDRFDDMVSRKAKTIDDIVDFVAHYFKLRPEDITGNSREQQKVFARQIVMYMAKKYFNYTYQYIAHHLGGKIHTTAMHAYQKTEKELEKNKQLARDINALLHDMGVL